MGSPLVAGAVTRCSFGLAPSVLNVLPVNRVLVSNLPAANVLDSKPIVNIVPFGMCNSIANPTVATATAAALGHCATFLQAQHDILADAARQCDAMQAVL